MSGEELLQILERESYDASLGLYFERHKTHKVGLMNLMTWRFWKVHGFCVRHRCRRNFRWVVFPTPSFPVAKLGWIVGNADVHSAWKELKKNEKEEAEKSHFDIPNSIDFWVDIQSDPATSRCLGEHLTLTLRCKNGSSRTYPKNIQNITSRTSERME